jgi:hypothetical protein
MARPDGVRSPARWWGMYGDKDSLVAWACIDTSTNSPPGWSRGNLYPSPFMIDPGDTAHRFQVFTHYPPAVLHYYAQGFDTLAAIDAASPQLFSNAWTGEVSLDAVSYADRSTGVGRLPMATEFYMPRPNPTRGQAEFSFALAKEGEVALTIYDVAGAAVRKLVAGHRGAGVESVGWNGRNDAGQACGAGVYFAKLILDGKAVGTRRITVLK